jgi:hypothetical protein
MAKKIDRHDLYAGRLSFELHIVSCVTEGGMAGHPGDGNIQPHVRPNIISETEDLALSDSNSRDVQECGFCSCLPTRNMSA